MALGKTETVEEVAVAMVGEDMRTERVFLCIRHLLLCQKLIKSSRERGEYWI
jgi:hypothetical protein